MNIDPEIPTQVRHAYREQVAGFPKPQKVKVKLMEQVTDFCSKLALRLRNIDAIDGGWDPETGKVPVRITSNFEDVWVDDSTTPHTICAPGDVVQEGLQVAIDHGFYVFGRRGHPSQYLVCFRDLGLGKSDMMLCESMK